MVNDNENATGAVSGQFKDVYVNKFGMAVSVALLVSGLVWIAVNGQWLELLLPLGAFICFSLLGSAQRLYWKGFDPALILAAQGGNLAGYLFWTLLTWVLDWLIDCMASLIGLWLFLALAKGDVASSPWAMTWAVGCALAPPLLFVMPGPKKKGPYVFWPPLRLIGVLPWLFVPLAYFHPVTIPLVAVVLVAFTPFDLCWRIFKELKKELWTFRSLRFEYLCVHGDTVPQPAPRENHRCWRPRPGILFEMPFNPYFGIAEAQWDEWLRPFLTIRSINPWGVALSAAALSFGCWGSVRTGHPHWLWAILVVCGVSWFSHGVADATDEHASEHTHDPDLQLMRVTWMSTLQFLAAVAMGSLLVWLLTPSWLAMGALCALLAAAWDLPHTFLFLASDKTERDPLELIVFALALGVTAAAMLCLRGSWLFALLPGVLILFFPRLRWSWPRSGLRGEARRARLREEERLERSEQIRLRGRSQGTEKTLWDDFRIFAEELQSFGRGRILGWLVCLAAAYAVAAFGGTPCLLWAPPLLVVAGTALVMMIVFTRSTFDGDFKADQWPKIMQMLSGRKGVRRFAAFSNFALAVLMPISGFTIIAWVDPEAILAAQALLVLLCMVLLPLSCLRRPPGVVVFGSLGAVALWALLQVLGQSAWAESSLFVSPTIAAVVHSFYTRRRGAADELEDAPVNHEPPSSPVSSASKTSRTFQASRRPYRPRPSRRR